MTDVFIYDHVRTPRGKGKADGALAEITPVQLAAQMLQAVRERNQLDSLLIEDVLLGCVVPVGEQGGDIARVAVLVDEKKPAGSDRPAGFGRSRTSDQNEYFIVSESWSRSVRPRKLLMSSTPRRPGLADPKYPR